MEYVNKGAAFSHWPSSDSGRGKKGACQSHGSPSYAWPDFRGHRSSLIGEKSACFGHEVSLCARLVASVKQRDGVRTAAWRDNHEDTKSSCGIFFIEPLILSARASAAPEPPSNDDGAGVLFCWLSR